MYEINMQALDRLVLIAMVFAGLSFMMIGLQEDNDDPSILDVFIFAYANIATIVCFSYTIFRSITQWR